MAMYHQDCGTYPFASSWGQGLQALCQRTASVHLPIYKQDSRFQIAVTYLYLLDGDHFRDGRRGALSARSVVMYCDNHATLPIPSKRTPLLGNFPVLRQDGATELIPGSKVRYLEVPLSSPEIANSSNEVVFQFPE